MLLSLSFIAYSYGLTWLVVWFGRFYFSFSYSRSFLSCEHCRSKFFYVIKLHMKRLTTVGYYDAHSQIS